MGTISTGVGLISGMNIQELVTQLMAIESKPLDLLKARIDATMNQKKAYFELNALVLGIKSALSPLTKIGTFRTRAATSSNEAALTATAADSTPTGTYRFTVAGLAGTHQLVSAGFADRSSTVGAGMITFEVGRGNVAPATALADLNGGAGVRRGIIRVTDRAGGTADVDLRTATDLQEVVDAINAQSSARIQARIESGRLVLADTSGGAANLAVMDLGTGKAAADLGIVGSFAAERIVSGDLLTLTTGTRLDRLNDGLGVRTNGNLDDFSITARDDSVYNVSLARTMTMSTPLNLLNDGAGVERGEFKITNRAGVSAIVDLGELPETATIQDVVSKIGDAGISVTASLVGGKLTLTDGSEGTVSNLKVEEVGTGHTAADLGIKMDVAANTGQGVNVYRMDTIAAVIRAINEATGDKITAAISGDGHGLTLTDTTTGTTSTQVTALNDSKAAADLGLLGSSDTGSLTGRYLLGGPNTVLLSSLNGGSGVSTGGLVLTRQVGGTTTQETIDVSGAHTLADILDAINSHEDGSGAKVFQAEISSGGTGIQIRDIAGGSLTAASGATATDLKLQASNGQLIAADLNLRWLSESTKLADLNGGKGISYGSFQVMASDGRVATLTLNSALHKTIGEVITAINALSAKDASGADVSLHVTARVNANGDGLELVDAAGGTSTLKVMDLSNGTSAADLGIAGTATGTTLTGTLAKTISVGSGDTLDDVVTKINAASAGVRASIINDGTSGSPYRLVLTSTTAGTAGQMNYSLSGLGLAFTTLSEADNAKVVVGDLNSASSIVVSSPTNTVKNVMDGLSLELHQASAGPVEITVKQDNEATKAAVEAFIKAFNGAIDKINEQTAYNADTKEKGILLGDAAVERVRDRLYRAVTATVSDAGIYKSLSQIGIVIKNGGHLVLNDEARFEQALATDPQAVEKLFTLTTKDSAGKIINKGIGVKFNAELDALGSSVGSVISQQQEGLQDRIDMFTKRSTDIQKLLSQKEARLYRQFQAMENALAGMQGQQSALTSLASMAASMSSTSSLMG